MKKSELAVQRFGEGFNCSQAVFSVFCEDAGLPLKIALRLSSGMGGGIGGMKNICGACSGMLLSAGLLYGYEDSDDPEGKKRTYAMIRSLASSFEEKNGALTCACLLENAPPLPPDAKHQPCCYDFVKNAVEILENYKLESR